MSDDGASGRDHLVKALGFGVVAVAAIVTLWKVAPVEEAVRSFLDKIDGLGFYGPLAYGLVYVVAAVLGIPRTPFNIGAGIIFSFPLALGVVLTAATISFALTFGISRYLAGDWVKKRISSVPNAEKIMQAVDEEGFKLVFLLRMNPFVPAVVKGYGFGTTTLAVGPYLLASFLGFLPIALAHVYLGWAGGHAMMSASEQPETWRTALLVGGGIASLLLVVFVTWFAKRAMNKSTKELTTT